MQRAVLIAAGGLLVLAAVLPFTSLGAWAVVPGPGAISGAVYRISLALRLAPDGRMPPNAGLDQAEEAPVSLKLKVTPQCQQS
jgi:hypothetical protein